MVLITLGTLLEFYIQDVFEDMEPHYMYLMTCGRKQKESQRALVT